MVQRQLVIAITGLALRRRFVFRPRFKRHSHLFGAHERPADIPVFRTAIERNEQIAVLAVRLEPVADFLSPLPEYLRAFRAFDFDLFVDHEMLRNQSQAFCLARLKRLFEDLLKL
jgi:hypothetical protein